ncbi:MAG TPA: twin-arginine translocase subunit TatC [Hyphomicrobiaceae bacterium]|nr:twin-arginine translocase subunit TatC [Hyphomicrobiaceae bacterium]
MQDATPTKLPGDEPKRDGHDEIEASKAPLLDHLIELRKRLIYSLIGIGIAFVVCFYFANQIYQVLVQPYVSVRGDKAKMIFTAPQEFFFTKLKLALFGAVCIAFPVIANQIYKFVAPGLYKNERQAFLPYLVMTPILFIVGALVVHKIVMPMMLQFFIGDEIKTANLEITLEARVSEYLSLIMTLILGFGVCFQLPVVLSLLARAGLIDVAGLRSFRRYAIVAITAVAAVLSPPDPFSMIAMMLPTVLLYEASILMIEHDIVGKFGNILDKFRRKPPAPPASTTPTG